MKNIFTLFIALILTANVFAQSPEGMSYQAVVRNASDALVQNSPVGMQISILQGGAAGTPVYVETQTPNTNANGLVSIEIGSGIVVLGDFATIDWTAGPYFIKTETDPTGAANYTISGSSQMMSVPYALYAKTSGSAIPGPQGDPGPTGATGATGPQGPTGLLPNGSAAGNTPYWDGSAWVTNSSNIFNDGNNIGIGTAPSTDAKLNVSGGIEMEGIQIKSTNSTQVGKTLNLGTYGALVMVNFYTQCQSTSTGGLLYIDGSGNVEVMSEAGLSGSTLTAAGNVLTITNGCGVTFNYTFNVTAGVATLVPGGFYTEARWIIISS
ncbi:MAG: collagen-like protein [Bacteroidia bacterium]